MKYWIFLSLLCLASLQARAQKMYLANAHIASCLNGDDSILEQLNDKTFRSNLISQTYRDGTLYIHAHVAGECLSDEPRYELKNDTLYLGATQYEDAPYIIDSTGRISLMKNYDPDRAYCACYYKVYFEFKNVAPDKIPVVFFWKSALPNYKLVVKDRKLAKVKHHQYTLLMPSDKGFLEENERVNQYDAQMRRQGKFVIDDDDRRIFYFVDDVPTHMISYKGYETATDLKTHYFKNQCHIICRISEHPNGQIREKSFLLSDGSAWYQLRWDEAGKIIYLKHNDKESAQLGD